MAADQLTDKEDQFKRRARRRLVGAVALVLLMVTVLPMVLDDRSGQKVSQPEISISIPSQNGAEFSSKIVPVAPTEPAPVAIASPVAPVPEKPVQPANEPPAAVTPAAQPQAQPEPAREAEKPAPKTPPQAATTPEATKAATVEVIKPAAVKKGSFSVQIGVFSDAAKVKQMRAKIADKGIQCYSENMATPKGTKYRVRCGPYAEKPAAQQALESLKTLGHNGILVTNQ